MAERLHHAVQYPGPNTDAQSESYTFTNTESVTKPYAEPNGFTHTLTYPYDP